MPGRVDEAAAIAAVDGIDMPFIGINDMAGSIGRLGQLDHPEVRELVERCERNSRPSGKPLGTVPRRCAPCLSLSPPATPWSRVPSTDAVAR
ncbi:MAG: hypothetical protein R3C69_16290 [Geminicoccaceae bacterium]